MKCWDLFNFVRHFASCSYKIQMLGLEDTILSADAIINVSSI